MIPDLMQIGLPVAASQKNIIAAAIIVVRTMKRLMDVRYKVDDKSKASRFWSVVGVSDSKVVMNAFSFATMQSPLGQSRSESYSPQ